ncbi:hypothetical protein J2S58_002091 [Nakamurella flavida]|uniref:hypothetical protein n=1 Tax=Nakamurella flavida TaxID=363630 RepID=UPI00277DB10C|nr:hypothetical protein [Nakamurella flavida]MDP9778468.1 hypothetical protein [Nakamurella flavida]
MITTTARRITAALVLSGALCGLGAGMASAATPAAPVAQLSVSPIQSHGSTGITMIIDNTSGTDLTLDGVSNPYGHLQDRPAQVLRAHTSTTVSDYSDSGEGAQLDVTYSTPNGGTVDFYATVPLAGSNSATATSLDPALTATTLQAGTGWHPTDEFTVAAA